MLALAAVQRKEGGGEGGEGVGGRRPVYIGWGECALSFVSIIVKCSIEDKSCSPA